VAPEGVVGVVQTVDPTMSLAILFAHPTFRVSAMSADGSAFGIVQPHSRRPSTAPSSVVTRLGALAARAARRSIPEHAQTGRRGVQLGTGRHLPAGIPVGVVLGEIKTAEAWARTYLLRPAVNPAEIDVGDGADAPARARRADERVGGDWSSGLGDEADRDGG
jgi:hypothetical protein